MSEITGTSGADILTGTSDNDFLNGLAGDDQLIDTLGGNDQLSGGDGQDILRVERNMSVAASTVLIDGGSDDDVLRFLAPQRRLDTVFITGGSGKDTIETIGGLAVKIDSGDGDDNVNVSGAFMATVTTGSGSDRVTTLGSGIQRIDVGAGDDFVSIQLSSTATVIALGDGNDTIALSPARPTTFSPVTISINGTATIDLSDFLRVNLSNWDGVTNPFSDGHLSVSGGALSIDFDGAYDGVGAVPLIKVADGSHVLPTVISGYDSKALLVGGLQLTGTAFDDTLTGSIGDDRIDGGAGSDTISGGPGNDTLKGGDGVDFIDGGAGSDVLYGGDGDDYLSDSGRSIDILDGGAGNDTIAVVRPGSTLSDVQFSSMVTTLTGGTGDDKLTYYSDSLAREDYLNRPVTLDGGSGDDWLEVHAPAISGQQQYGYAYILLGGEGNDTILLDVKAADIKVDGGNGNDKIVVRMTGGDFYEDLDISAGMGADSLDITADAGAGINIYLGEDTDQDRVTISGTYAAGVPDGGARTVIRNFMPGSTGDVLDIRGLIARIIPDYDPNANPFSAGYVQLSDSGASTIISIGGHPIIRIENVLSSSLTDHNLSLPLDSKGLLGTSQDDILTGGSGNDYLDALAGNDRVFGGAGNDKLFGGQGSDYLEGGDGDDILDGGSGVDTMIGGAGNDAYSADLATDMIVEQRDGGIDTIYFSPGFSSTDGYVLPDNVENLTLGINAKIGIGNALDNIIRGSGLSSELKGNAGNDQLFGTGRADIIDGGEGDDYLDGGAGADAMTGGAGNDIYVIDDINDTASEFANGGNDAIRTTVSFTLPSNVERLELLGAEPLSGTGSSGNDTLVGNSGANTLNGAAGNDLLIGGGGNDTLTGGIGDDIFQGTGAELAGDSITDFSHGDRINVTDASVSGFTYSRAGSQLTLSSGGVIDIGSYRGGFRLAGASLGVDIIAAAVARGDFTGDGHSDILFRNVSGAVSTWNVSGDGKQVQQSAFNAAVDPSWKIAETFDWNGDAKADILFRNDNGAVAIWNAQGAGFNQASYYHAPVGNDWRIAGAGDLTGDGKDDLLWQNANGSISAWTSTGTGFAESTYNHGSPGGGWMVQGLGDFTGDGKADILWRNTGGGVAMWSNNGAGTSFNEGAFFTNSVATSWHIDGIGDFNGDGRDDMLWRNDNGALSVWRSNGSGFDQGVYNANVPTDWHIDQIGDLNGDGRADIVWRNDNGAVSTWQSNGAGFDQSVYNSSAPTSWAIEAHDFLV